MAQDLETAFKPVSVTTRDGREKLIREYAPRDFRAVVEMYKSFLPKRVAQGLPPPDVPRIANWLDRVQQRSRSLLACDGVKVIGHAILCPISDASVEYTIFVHQDFRCQGLGTEMTSLALDFAGRMGFAEAFLSTELKNYAALSLYRSAGFHMTNAFGEECEMRISVVSPSSALPRVA